MFILKIIIDRFPTLMVSLNVLLLLAMSSLVSAQRVSDIANTKHNFSTSGQGLVKASSETQICVFCHTPHQAENLPGAPLWNRKASGATYTPYASSSIDATDITATPGGSSKLCLSCHDGTIAIGSVNVANAQENVTINMQGTGAAGEIPSGAGDNTGYTRKLGTDLSNDHPISFTYNSNLAALDGELRDPAIDTYIANRRVGNTPLVPLEKNKVQCTSCHDPHIRDADATKNIKFLRLNRFQQGLPSGGGFNKANDIICLACHNKLGQAWSTSAHANSTVANETYNPTAAAQREFPVDLPVWQAACLNCHDTHSVQGSRRLLREGTDSISRPKTGGLAAQEQTCYSCHSADGAVLNGQGSAGSEVPDIKTDFTTGLTHMPITTADQRATSETHDVVNADLIENKTKFNNGNRHVECTDCHNPHRLSKNRVFNNTGDTLAGTHNHNPPHNNIASGVLRGSWGVEPSYGSDAFSPSNLPVLYATKSGDAGNGASTAVINSYVTREYQICLKCHSDFAYGNTPPFLGDTGGNTPFSQSNGINRYTNQAMEIQAPPGHQREGTSTTSSGSAAAFSNNNHRSWHPVLASTGRTLTEKVSAEATNWLAPWNNAGDIGNQTMYCSDCHGSDTAAGTVVPNGGENGKPWGPHGSSNNFILKGNWSSTTGSGSPNDLCFKCHNYNDYASSGNRSSTTGYCCGGGGGGMGGNGGGGGGGGMGRGNLHAFHTGRLGRIRCNWCHVAVPHGWKNKALLVNLNDVGPEAGFASTGNEVSNNGGYSNAPYYNNAMLKIVNFATSGNWSASNCGSASGATGRRWMMSTCRNPP